MLRVWRPFGGVLAGLFVAAMCAFPQTTVSAWPGTLNYVEGHAFINGQEVDQKQMGHIALEVGQTLRLDPNSKAEMLLTPGVFFRLGGNGEARMVSNSLIDTRVAVTQGEALVDVAKLFKDNNIQILTGSSSTKLLKNGLYRFNAGTSEIAVIDGKAEVWNNDQHVKLGKGKLVNLASASGKLKANKFNTKQEDDLYAWSNLRAEYAAEATYATAKNINVYNYGGLSSGWLWNPVYGSWAFMPWGGYAYSPFGWGFFSPGYLAYAPIYYSPWRRHIVPVNPRRIPRSIRLRPRGIRPGIVARPHVARPIGPRPAGPRPFHRGAPIMHHGAIHHR
jgi:hypothetical protein